MASSTRSRVSARTFGSRFITLDTVLMETPARAATSVILALPDAMLDVQFPDDGLLETAVRKCRTDGR